MPKIKQSPASEMIDIVKRNIEARCAYFGLKTDREIAARLNMPPTSYTDRRHNPRSWTLEQLVLAAMALKCTPQWLFTDHSAIQDEKGEVK